MLTATRRYLWGLGWALAATPVCSQLATANLDSAPAPVDLRCPPSPNCVNSLPGSELEPLRYAGTPQDGQTRLLSLLATMPDVTITETTPGTVRTIFTTLLGFKDEVIFVMAATAGTIDYRSRSLLGYYDFGKNHARMQAFKSRFEQSVPTKP